MHKLNKLNRTDDCINGKDANDTENKNNKVWLTMIPRSSKCKSYSYLYLDSHLWRSMCMILMEGSYMDKASTVINNKFLKVLIDECKTSFVENEAVMTEAKTPIKNNPNGLVSRTFKKVACEIDQPDADDSEDHASESDNEAGDSAEDEKVNILKINTRRVFKKIRDLNLPFFIPFNFLHPDVEYNKLSEQRVMQLDIHERILFQMLHGWNGINRNERQNLLVQATLARPGRYTENDVEYMKTLTQFSKESLFMLLVRARGVDMTRNPVNTHDNHGEGPPRNFRDLTMQAERYRLSPSTVPSPFYIKTPCSCADNYYLTRLYHYFEQTFEKKQEMIQKEIPHDMDDFLDCRMLTAMLAETIFLVWDGVSHAPLMNDDNEIIHIDSINVIVDFKLVDTDHQFMHKISRDRLLRCNHKGINKMVMHMYFHNYGYALKDSVAFDSLFTIEIKPFLEDNALNIMLSDDTVLTERITLLERIYAIANTDKAFVKELCRFLDEHFEMVRKFPELEGKIRWIMFEFIYRRNIDVYPKVAMEPVDTNPKFERYHMTYGIITESCERWVNNDASIHGFLLSLATVYEVFRLKTLDQLISSVPVENPTPSGKTMRKKKQREKRKLNKQQQDTHEDEDDNTESKEDKKEEDISNQDILIAGKEISYPKPIGFEKKKWLQEIDDLINEATFCYIEEV